MPKLVNRYACDFNCGRRAVVSKKAMEKHESICWNNPKVKSCKTCKYYSKEEDGNGMDGTPYNETWTTELCDAIEESIDKIVVNCSMHELKDQPLHRGRYE
ncbi:hypothetical protein NVP1029O_58 [Vibrio phage 1.029.O._10N.261.55.A7]|nr:hypothetical protein NVP1029O_58 [Vibrio phage 1.029.O._10N.261.55.A7]